MSAIAIRYGVEQSQIGATTTWVEFNRKSEANDPAKEEHIEIHVSYLAQEAADI